MPKWEQRPIKGTLANSVDPDQTQQNAASDQGQHCLHLIREFLSNMIMIKKKQKKKQTPLLCEMHLFKSYLEQPTRQKRVKKTRNNKKISHTETTFYVTGNCTTAKSIQEFIIRWLQSQNIFCLYSNGKDFYAQLLVCLFIYSWLSLSRTRLSRITAFLEIKICSLPKHENLTTC